jgi:3-deoxy-D-manno-octulosonic-acid transferase
MTAGLKLYAGVTGLLHALTPGMLKGRVKTGKEDPVRWRERLGETAMPRPDGAVVWFHGVSVGESLSALPVIERLRAERPDLCVILTTATTTSAEILGRRLPEGVIHQFAPIDTPQAAAAFLDHWRPGLAIFIESDIWPNLLSGLAARGVPHALLSARITEKTYQGWQAWRGAMRQVLSGYSLVMAQDRASDERLKAMGVTTGPMANLKTLGAALKVDDTALSALDALIGERRVILAASTHYGEDALIAHAVEAYLRDGDLLILAPRHPLKAGDIRIDIEALGLHVAQRSLKEPLAGTIQVYLADTLGELGLFFRLADLVIMGGSFQSGVGGHNPLEPARLGKSVITGPDTFNWQGIFDALIEAGGAFRVDSAADLTYLVGELRAHAEAVTTADARALEVSGREAGTLDRVWSQLVPLLPEHRP